ncbi:MAG: hypothetical protein FJ088_10270, partial [Deltaproteobacteria bacterium]|nr:hypothetical protein [Deltaproteobacteria bacterium]
GGFTDETFEFTDWDSSKKKKGEACGTGECKNGVVQCNQSQSGVECSTKNNSSAEKCDQKDNDCDGKTDAEDPADLASGDTQYCENQSGVCYGAVKQAYLCDSGIWLPCSTTEFSAHSQIYEETETLCDGYDNDCSGASDENCPTIFLGSNSTSGGLLHDETSVYIIFAGAVSTPSAVIKNGSGMTIKLGFLPSFKEVL